MFKITGLSMRRLLLISLLLVPICTSTPTSLSERTLSDFGSLNLGLWTVDLNAVYDFFAAPAVQRNFFIVQTSKVGVKQGVEQCHHKVFIHVIRQSGAFLAFLSATRSGR